MEDRSGGGRDQHKTADRGMSTTITSNEKGDRTKAPPKAGGTDTAQTSIKKAPRTKNKTGGKSSTNSPPVKIESNNFQSNFHKCIARAAKYKVHAPYCTCSKVKTIRQRYIECIDSRQPSPPNISAQKNSNTTTSSYNDHVQFDVDGGFSQKFDEMLQLSSDVSIFDNLIVMPDTYRPSAVYVCRDTNSARFKENGIACEQKLSMEIFASKKGDSGGNDDIPPFKVSCAICLLTNHQPNGFAAITSDSFDRVQHNVDKARDAFAVNAKKGLHSDHAHFVCALDISSLQLLQQSGKTRSAWSECTRNILNQMNDAGVKLSTDARNFMSSGEKKEGQEVKISFGHHLSSLLHIMADKCPNNSISITSKRTMQLKYIMIIGYEDNAVAWELDLPGGKRHLGETTIEGAIREVEEECSLILDRDWLEGQVPLKYGGIKKPRSSTEWPETMGGFVRVFETEGDAFVVMIPSSLV